MIFVADINHIAIIVPDLEGAVAFWEGALGLKLARTESDINRPA